MKVDAALLHLGTLSQNVLYHRIRKAIQVIAAYGQIEESHHRAWAIDQVTRTLLGDDYDGFVRRHCTAKGGPYTWDTGVAP